MPTAHQPLVEADVEIQTPDGTCNSAFLHPQSGAHPGVLLWPDVFGLRPAMRQIARLVAREGYSVLVPNPFYRVARAPFETASNFDFKNPADTAKLAPLRASITPPENAVMDAVAYIGFLDARKEVDRSKKVGTVGYCMSGPLAVRTAAAVPDRVGAAASFHGGNLVTDKPDSPHRLAPKIRARMYFAIAKNDDEKQPDAKDKLKEAFPSAEIEVYTDALHGWCIPDMPPHDGQPVYNEADADRAMKKLIALLRAALT